MSNMKNSPMTISETNSSVATEAEGEMTVAEYREWVDALVLRAESLEKARLHTPSKVISRSSL